MKKCNFFNFLIIIAFYILINQLNAQELQGPESIVFDKAHSRYLISNMNSGEIVAKDTSGKLFIFATGLKQPKGILILGETLYVSDFIYMKAYNLNDGSLKLNLLIPESTFLNDICADSSGNLYIDDTKQNKIFKYNIKSKSLTSLKINGSLNSPNGMIYEKEQNRLVMVSFIPNSPIERLDFRTMAIITMKTTYFSYLNGITKDKEGNYYISSWGFNPNLEKSGQIIKFNSKFLGNGEVIYNNLDGPADIFYNDDKNELLIPNLEKNTVITLKLK